MITYGYAALHVSRHAGTTWVFSAHFHGSGLRMIKGRGRWKWGLKDKAENDAHFKVFFNKSHLFKGSCVH